MLERLGKLPCKAIAKLYAVCNHPSIALRGSLSRVCPQLVRTWSRLFAIASRLHSDESRGSLVNSERKSTNESAHIKCTALPTAFSCSLLLLHASNACMKPPSKPRQQIVRPNRKAAPAVHPILASGVRDDMLMCAHVSTDCPRNVSFPS